MDFALVVIAASVASGLTMLSGFGLGTLLLPVFALFLPVDLAVAATALVHGANNVLKVGLLGRMADLRIVLRFGVPAIIAAFAGVWVLRLLSGMPELWTYSFLGRPSVVSPLKLAMATLMAGFAVLELHPRFERLEIDRRWLPVGGVLSGFFGGLSGHQGALRSAFLAKVGISPQAFVGTNAVIGLLVDLVRISAYGAILFGARLTDLARSREGALVAAGALAAFTGVIVGKRVLHKITMVTVQRITGGMLLLIALALGLGVV
ncbi:MAG: sulfite exporter TauE/SafE family protein [Thermoanaerobaculales bacterium]|jgi:hypothetical protein|nr:sulfite exporter TauE/SafE family protein [Thermoanaerobaculales bacterium]